MIYVGIDDTDTIAAPGTNQLAKALAARLADQYACDVIVRHQLLLDPRVPYTSKNSAASLILRPRNGSGMERLIDELRTFLGERFVEGSDPGFCVTPKIPDAVVAYGRQCQREVVTQDLAKCLATEHHIHLEGCGGTNDGVIGALAAVGLIAQRNDGRVVQIADWPDDLSGPQDVAAVCAREVRVRRLDGGADIEGGTIDVGKHLRPNYRRGEIVLFAREVAGGCCESSDWQAVRFT